MSEASVNKNSLGGWYLESLSDGGKHVRRVPITSLPFRIGRRSGLELTIPWDSISKEHAEIYEDDETLRLRDLRSTNGTFVHRERVTDTPIYEGDVLHFADFECRLRRQRPGEADNGAGECEEHGTVALGDVDLPSRFVAGGRELAELIRNRAVEPVFQPIVTLPNPVRVAYEVLGRGRHPGLPEAPADLFQIAASLGVEVELSRLFRRVALERLSGRDDLPTIFLNTHPAELGEPDFFDSLREMRLLVPRSDLVIEIHESALADPASLATVRSRLSEIHIGLAYDDFGAGQARLLELGEVPPHYLKFDLRFIRGIDQAPPSKRRLLSSLVAAARDLLVHTVAEGIETEAEAEVCAKIGFTHAQGFLFGPPVSANEL
jgi:EAL domain-containing protein (putative c-di-GMP-specific phosphodiesterase class I)